MRDNFEKSLRFVLMSEGGFSNHPNDPGKETNQGITLKTLIDYHQHFDYGDLDNDGGVDIDDVRLLDTPEEAAPIYRRYFWDKVWADALPNGVDYFVFDSAVNHGPANAGRFLQRGCNRLGCGLVVDGSIGPKTVKAALAIPSGALISEMSKERDIFYRKIVANDHSQEQFFRGWMNRLARVTEVAREMAG